MTHRFAYGRRRAGWWTLPCVLVLCIVPALIFLVSFGCAISEVGNERMQARCVRAQDGAWLLSSLIALPLLLVLAALVPRRVTFVATAVLVLAQTVVFVYLTQLDLPTEPRF